MTPLGNERVYCDDCGELTDYYYEEFVLGRYRKICRHCMEIRLFGPEDEKEKLKAERGKRRRYKQK